MNNSYVKKSKIILILLIWVCTIINAIFLLANMRIKQECLAMNTRFENQWNGKKCAVIGSSISEMGGWTDILKNALGFSELYNRGSGGTTLADLSKYNLGDDYPVKRYVYKDTTIYGESSDTVFSTLNSAATNEIDAWYCSEERINLIPTDVDLVIFDACTNDAYRTIGYATEEEYQKIMSSAEFGDIWSDENYDTSTIEGAFYTFVKKVQIRCPNARIVCLGMPFNTLFTTRENKLDKYMEMYIKIESLCKKTGVVFIDTMMYEGANKFNITEYHEDFVHPATTELGKRSVANAIIGVLKNIYPKNYLITESDI